jgi:hypothetical protein
MFLRFWFLTTIIAVAASPARAGSYYLVSSRIQGSPGEGGLYRLADLNGDGDAMDVGENILWGRNLDSPGMVRRFGTNFLAADASRGQLVRYEDVNGDGDALDPGESTVWADNLGLLVGLDTTINGTVMAADLAAGQVFQLQDVNGDGDALDAGERKTYASGIEQVVSLLIAEDAVYAVSNALEQVQRLTDLNGDGDALDMGERVPFAASGVIAPGLLDYTSLFDLGDGTMLLSAYGTGMVFQIRDTNGDNDALDLVEVLQYANSTHGALSGPWDMARYVRPTGEATDGALVVESLSGEVSLLLDINGDGDALDVGEVVPWAMGLSGPIGIVASVDVDGDANGDLLVNDADLAIFLDQFGGAWNGLTFEDPDFDNDGIVDLADFVLMRANWGAGAGASPEIGDVTPEPATMSLLAIGGLAVLRRRRKQGGGGGSGDIHNY